MDRESDTATVGPEAQSPPRPDPPALDTFRLDANGQMLVAGRALPGGRVAITVNDARIGTAKADGSGKFVAFLDLPPSEAARVLGLELLLEDGGVIRATDEVLIAPTPRPDPEPEAVAEAGTPDPESKTAGEAETGITGPSAPVPDPVAETGTAEPEAIAEPVAEVGTGAATIAPGSETGDGAETGMADPPATEPDAVAETEAETETAAPPAPSLPRRTTSPTRWPG